ncbi:hypothetical protein [Actinokineospora sp. HUAS TT18]|uniref:hypothetical protein n=1 Tax=Actinokineospora sp. HUAS TT18 TaxID=3447451 RepID=UPI003F526218
MAERDAYELAGRVLRGLDPAEVPDLPEVWAAYWADPVSPEDLADRDRMLGSGLPSTLAEWAPLVVAYLGTEVVAGAAVDAVKARIRRGVGEVFSKAPKKVSFDDEQLVEVGERARAAALAAGRSSEDAERFAEAVVGSLDRGDE